MGTVKAVRVKEGDTVKAGDLTGSDVDDRKVSAQFKQAQAALARSPPGRSIGPVCPGSGAGTGRTGPFHLLRVTWNS